MVVALQRAAAVKVGFQSIIKKLKKQETESLAYTLTGAEDHASIKKLIHSLLM